MKTKNKIKIFVFLFILLLAGFFSFKNICLADEKHLLITEIFPNPFGSEKEKEFIELYNPTKETIDLTDWQLSIKTTDLKSSDSYLLSDDIKSGEYKSLYNTITLYNKKSIVSLTNSKLELVNEITYSTPNKEDFSYSLICNLWGWVYPTTPNKENPSCESEDDTRDEETPPEETKDYSKIKINEIYPAPITKNDEEEFVEIINESEEKIDFSNWIIKDSKGAKGKISKIENSENFVVFYGSFSLNNDSKGDTVFLYDAKGNLIDSQKYSGGKSAYSYSFDGSSWRWTSFATPTKENIFDKILSGKITISKKIYKNTYAYFNVASDKNAKKFTWNFGDGHKSYLKSTKHKYEKTGKYSASLKITGDGEDKFYEFEVKVEKYDAPKIRIVSLSPNPKGSDTKNEWIEIKNESKKKINLKGWSIATGWKKLINHPIREKFEIKPGKTKKLLRDICAFTLVNTKDKIELRDPSGKTVQKIKYDHGKKSISEDELYSKIDNEWLWLNTPTNTDLTRTNTEIIENALLPYEEKDEFNIPESEIQANLGKYSPSPIWQKKQKDRQILAYSSTQIIFPEKLIPQNSRVLGVMTGFKPVSTNNRYLFTTPTNQKHWVIEFSDSIWLKINSELNRLLLKI